MTREEVSIVLESLSYDLWAELSDRQRDALDMAIEAMKEQRPRGVWKEVCDFDGNHYKWECSVCGRLEEFEEDFCNCGADMRKEGDAE